jgi:hypothetical protein
MLPVSRNFSSFSTRKSEKSAKKALNKQGFSILVLGVPFLSKYA